MTIFEDKVKKYGVRLMKDFQIQDFHSAGIFGNMGTETGGFKHMQELNPVVKGSRGGFGWSQWTGPRRKKFEAWAKEKGLDIRDDETNYLYLVHETLTDEWKSLAQLRKTTTLEAATETWMKLNLRPGVPHLESRLGWARKAQDALKLTTGTLPTLQKKSSVRPSQDVAVGTVFVGTAAIAHFLGLALPWVIGIGAAGLIGYIIYRIITK